MRRWNGWGDDTITYPLHQGPKRFLEKLLGPGTPPKDATLEQVLAKVPPSRLPDHPLISYDAEERVPCPWTEPARLDRLAQRTNL